MRFQSGKREGKTLEEVLLKEPDFAQWYLKNHPYSLTAREFGRLMEVFDAKPFTAPCCGCGQPATVATAYRNNPSLMFWCDSCPAHSSGAARDRLDAVITVGEALRHIDWTADGHRAWKRKIVRELATAKGLPKRVGEKQALLFFN